MTASVRGRTRATSSDCRITSTALKIAASGLRSSWANIARNRSRWRTALRDCSYSRALSMASAPRPARSAASANSAGPNRRDGPAATQVIVPIKRPRATSGKAIAA